MDPRAYGATGESRWVVAFISRSLVDYEFKCDLPDVPKAPF